MQHIGCRDDYSPNPFDCTKFYRCSFGYQTSFQCALGTCFDRRLKICNSINKVPECLGINLPIWNKGHL